MRIFTAKEQKLFESKNYTAHFRVWVKDALGVWVNLSDLDGLDYLLSASWSEDVDTPVSEASFEFTLRVYNISLSPLMGTSKLNNGGPLIAPNREIRLERAITAPDERPLASDWRLQWSGITVSVDVTETVRVVARDRGWLLQRTWVETATKYGGNHVPGATLNDGVWVSPVENSMQKILDDWMPGETLHVPQSPGFFVTEYEQEKAPLLDALKKLAEMIGWDVRYRYGEAEGYRLEFYEPPRDKDQTELSLSPDTYFEDGIDRLEVSGEDVRNRIKVVFGPADDRQEVVVEDLDSQARYGKVYMEIAEASSSAIDTAQEATRLASAALHDLKEPKAEIEITTLFLPWVELGDFYTFEPNGEHLSEAMNLAVVGYAHDLSGDGVSTRLTLRGSPAGHYYRWFDREARPGVAKPGDATKPGLPLSPLAFFGSKDFIVSWNEQPDARQYLVRVKNGSTTVREALVTETRYVYPYEQNRADNGTPLTALTAEVLSVKHNGNWSDPVPVAAVNPPPSAPVNLTVDVKPLEFVISMNDPNLEDYERTEVEFALQPDFSDAVKVFDGRAFSGITLVPRSLEQPNYVRVRFVDSFGQVSAWESTNAVPQKINTSEIANGAIDATKFANDIRAPKVVSQLPTLPNSSFPDDALVLLTSDGKLYRNRNGTWVPEISAQNLTGQIQAGQIAANAVTAGTIAVGAVGADQIAANSITVKHLTVADPSNLVLNNLFNQNGGLDGWVGVTGPNTNNGSGYERSVSQPDRDAYFAHPFAEAIPCTPGQTYYVSAMVRNATGSTYPFTVGIAFWNSSGSIFSWVSGASAPVGTTNWTLIGGQVTAPSGAVRMSFWTHIPKTTGTETSKPWEFTNPVLRVAANSFLIVDGAITADKIAANAVVAGKIAASAVTADTIASGAVTADKIAANAVDTNKLTAGTIELSNSARQNAQIVVKDGSNATKLVFGNISGLDGVPSGTQYGLWGTLGSGVYIKGAPKVVAAGNSGSFSVSIPGLTSGSNYTATANHYIVGNTFTVPTGKNWLVIVSPRKYSTGDPNLVIWQFEASPLGAVGATVYPTPLLDGTYDSLRISAVVRVRALTTTTGSNASFEFDWVIIEVDATIVTDVFPD